MKTSSPSIGKALFQQQSRERAEFLGEFLGLFLGLCMLQANMGDTFAFERLGANLQGN